MAEVGARKLRLVDESRGGPENLAGEHLVTLGGRSISTVEAYGRILRFHQKAARADVRDP
jgi:hypothetical protein